MVRPSRDQWRCFSCGRRWTLDVDHCHGDDCEVRRKYAEDEDAIPLPVLRTPNEGVDDKSK